MREHVVYLHFYTKGIQFDCKIDFLEIELLLERLEVTRLLQHLQKK